MSAVVAPYGPLRVGRLQLPENYTVQGKGGDQRSLSLSGALSPQTGGTLTPDNFRATAAGLLDYAGRVVPVRFTAFPHLDGWYTVTASSADETTWYTTTEIEWSLDLTLVGGDSQVDVESRLIGGNRTHVSVATAELWHAVPPATTAYVAGSGSPGYVDRASVDGAVRVFRAIPAATHPRWSCPVAGYLAGAAQVAVNGLPRAGTTCPDTPGNWTLSNGLVRVTPLTSGGTFGVAAYSSGSWSAIKSFDLKRNGVSIGPPAHVTILRNDPAEVILRLTFDHAPARSTVDVGLKRGSRFATLVAQQSNVTGPWRVDDVVGAGTVSNQIAAAGYIERTDADAAGNRWVIGTPVAAAQAGAFGLVASASSAVIPVFVGCVVGGAAAVAGDTAAALNAQYLGTPSETERYVRR